MIKNTENTTCYFVIITQISITLLLLYNHKIKIKNTTLPEQVHNSIEQS
jgi:uncharacterized protein with PQ loop repeat